MYYNIILYYIIIVSDNYIILHYRLAMSFKLKSLHRLIQRRRIAGSVGPQGPTVRARARRTARKGHCTRKLAQLAMSYLNVETKPQWILQTN